MSDLVQRFAGSTDGLAFHEPVVIVYARELNALEAKLSELRDDLREADDRFDRFQDEFVQPYAALKQRVVDMEEDGHSMDCEVRKESDPMLPPDCSCGWTQRLEDMATSGEDRPSA